MLHFIPGDLPVPKVHQLLLGGVAPRPIALVSTVAEDGTVNLSPFSFFNAFGANPPIVAFSPSRRGQDGTFKDTYNNLVATGECVIQAVTYAMVQQVSLASTQYEPGVDEFAKSGLTPVPSDLVKPPRVAESPFQMECRLQQMVNLGEEPASGNLAICEVIKIHVAEDIFDNQIIDPRCIDLVGRNSGNFYTRAGGDAIFSVQKPLKRKGMGIDQLPEFIRTSRVLSANNLGQLGNTETVPEGSEVDELITSLETAVPDLPAFRRAERLGDYRRMLAVAIAMANAGHTEPDYFVQLAAKCALDRDDVDFGWKALIYCRTLAGTRKT